MTQESEFDRGHIAGGIAERLASHDRHFEAINGSIADVARELAGLKLGVQRLADQAVADAKTRVTTAEAVEKARKEAADALESERVVRRERSDQSWTPWQRLLAVIAGLGVVISIWLALSR